MDKRVVVVVFAFLFSFCFAGEEEKLDVLVKKIEARKREINEIKSEQTEYSHKITDYSKRLKNAKSRLTTLERKFSGKSKEKEKLKKQIAEVKKEIEDIHAMYTLAFIRLYEAEFIDEEPVNSQVLSYFVQSSSRKAEIYSERNIKLQNSTVSINRQIRELEKKKDKEVKNIKFSQYVTSAANKSLVDSKKKEKKISKELAFLQEEREKLERIIANLKLDKMRTGYSYKFSQSHILWPVRGEIVENDLRKSGLDISTKDKYCKAVDNGIVADYDKIGNKKCLIVDHRNGYISVYIYKGSTLAEMRSEVKRGQNLALLQSDLVHFELRKDRKNSVDPRGFFVK